MDSFIGWRWSVALAWLALGAISSAAATLASDPIVSAVSQGDCSKAVSELKAETNTTSQHSKATNPCRRNRPYHRPHRLDATISPRIEIAIQAHC
jgi:hypothetical protein